MLIDAPICTHRAASAWLGVSVSVSIVVNVSATVAVTVPTALLVSPPVSLLFFLKSVVRIAGFQVRCWGQVQAELLEIMMSIMSVAAFGVLLCALYIGVCFDVLLQRCSCLR